MFLNVGGVELLVIALVALIVVGPEQLPGLMRRAGRTAHQVRSMSLTLRDEFMQGVDEIDPRRWNHDPGVEADQSRTGTVGGSTSRGSGAMDDPIVPRSDPTPPPTPEVEE